ncbi:hypothetical protein BDV12DRAFT_189493 [Aspergillus spectabilis]
MTTPLQVIRDEGLESQLSGNSVLITGASSGIGVETAKAFFATGATLYLTSQTLDKAKAAPCVRATAKELLSKTTTLNIFIANAGVMAAPEGRTKDNFETQFGVNYLAHFLLFILLRPALLDAATPDSSSRVVFLSSIAHRYSEVVLDNTNLVGEYEKWKAYGQSKCALLWVANEIDRRYASQGLRAFSVQPGGEEQAATLEDPILAPQLKSAGQGAATSTWAAVSKSLEGMGGIYLENVQISKPWVEAEGNWAPGYAPHAYNPEGERRLFDLSLNLVGEKE